MILVISSVKVTVEEIMPCVESKLEGGNEMKFVTQKPSFSPAQSKIVFINNVIDNM